MPDRISPTAHYTAAVWARHGLSHPAFATLEGRLLHTVLLPTTLTVRLLGGPELEGFLLARHRRIDELLEAAIDEGRITQVLEIAAGMSPRGWRFTERHGGAITYVEADLPAMARRKREALREAGAEHEVAEIDALAADGPDSLAAIVERFDPDRGLAIITEGLLNYLDRDAVEDLWARVAATLSGFSEGLYLSDLFLAQQASGVLARGFSVALGVFVRGRIHMHYRDEDAALQALGAAGFGAATLHQPGDRRAGAAMVRVVAAQPR